MLKDKLNRVIEEAAKELGYQIYETSALIRGENTKIVVKIDRVEGITLDDCEKFSKRLDLKLENEEIVPNYTLEVSSPGLNRKLRNIDEIKRFAGSPVKIIYQEEEKRVVYQGAVTGIDGENINIKSDNRDLILEYRHVVEAFLDY